MEPSPDCKHKMKDVYFLAHHGLDRLPVFPREPFHPVRQFLEIDLVQHGFVKERLRIVLIDFEGLFQAFPDKPFGGQAAEILERFGLGQPLDFERQFPGQGDDESLQAARVSPCNQDPEQDLYVFHLEPHQDPFKIADAGL